MLQNSSPKVKSEHRVKCNHVTFYLNTKTKSNIMRRIIVLALFWFCILYQGFSDKGAAATKPLGTRNKKTNIPRKLFFSWEGSLRQFYLKRAFIPFVSNLRYCFRIRIKEKFVTFHTWTPEEINSASLNQTDTHSVKFANKYLETFCFWAVHIGWFIKSPG